MIGLMRSNLESTINLGLLLMGTTKYATVGDLKKIASNITQAIEENNRAIERDIHKMIKREMQLKG